MTAIRNEPSKPERGQILVIFALSVTAFVLVLALVLDGGRVYAERRRTQNAADAAATAGAAALNHAAVAASLLAVQTAACKAAYANGFGSGLVDSTCGPGGSVVDIHVPGGDGGPNLPNVADSFKTSGYVQVAVTSTFVSFIQSWLGGSHLSASALAVAVNIPGAGIGASVLVLNAADCGSFNINGTGTILTLHNGGLMVNSSAAKSASATCTIKNAATVSGGATLTTDSPYQNNVVGTGDLSVNVTPPFTDGADFAVDQLAFVHVPDFGQTGPVYVPSGTHPTILGQPALSNSPFNPSLGPQPWKNTASNPYPDPLVGMSPGVVWGGIEVHNGDTLVLQGGTYIMAGGGFNIQGGSVLALNPVTIIMTNDEFCNTSNSANCSDSGLKGNGNLSATVGQSTGSGSDSWGSPPGFACAAASTNLAACQPIDAPAANPNGEDYLNHILIYIDREVGPCSSGVGNPSVGNTTFIAGGGGAYYFATGTIIYAPCSSVSLYGTNSPFLSHAGSVEAFNVSVSGNKTLDLGGPGPNPPAPSKTNLVQ